MLVFGGSQGAHAINRVVVDSAAGLCEKIPRLHIIHQTGERDFAEVQASYAKQGLSGIEVHAFIDDMPTLFQAC